RPEVRELHVALLEDRDACLPVLLDDVATLPGDLVIGVHAGGGEDALDLHALPVAATSRPCACAGRLCHCWPPWPLFPCCQSCSRHRQRCGSCCDCLLSASPPAAGVPSPAEPGSCPVASRSARSRVIADSKSSRLSNAW